MSKKPKMVMCRNCNASIAKNAKICPSCGVKNKKPFYKQWWFILLIIFIVIGAIGSMGGNKKEKFEWKELALCYRLPEPKSDVGAVIINSDDDLLMYVEKTSKEDYQDYVAGCQSLGYVIESEKDGERYNAFDGEGYKLSLDYAGETMHIELTAPEIMGTLNWPKSEVAALLPIPKSSVGKVSSDSADGCFIYVGKMSVDDFNAYVDECAEKGFVVDYERGDKFYYADDENGNHISLTYQGNNVISIEIKKSDDAEKEELTESESSGNNSELADGMRPEFKKAMDSYEEFMNEYCDFMKKYEESDGTDLEHPSFVGAGIYDSEFHSCVLEHGDFFGATLTNTHFYDSALTHVTFQKARLKCCNTIDCALDHINYLNATLDGCSFGRVTPSNIRNLPFATITQGGATREECQQNREAIFRALGVEEEAAWWM